MERGLGETILWAPKNGFPQTPFQEKLFGKIIKGIYYVGFRCYDKKRKHACVPYASGPASFGRHPGCKASGERLGLIRRESLLSPWDYPRRSGARSPLSSLTSNASGGNCLLIPIMLFRQMWVQGVQPPGWGLGRTAPAFPFSNLKRS